MSTYEENTTNVVDADSVGFILPLVTHSLVEVPPGGLQVFQYALVQQLQDSEIGT